MVGKNVKPGPNLPTQYNNFTAIWKRDVRYAFPKVPPVQGHQYTRQISYNDQQGTVTYTITDKTAKKSDTVMLNHSDPGFPSPFSPNDHISQTFIEFHSHIPNDPPANAPFPGPYTLQGSGVSVKDGNSIVTSNQIAPTDEPHFNY